MLEDIVADLIEKVETRYFGKYRGFVVSNADPEHLGRLQVTVPAILGPDVVTGWAMPCAPFGGLANQGFLFIPDEGAGVWIEFEGGDLEFPIWTGTFWSKPEGKSELPRPNAADGQQADAEQHPPTRKIIKTGAGHTIQLVDDEEKATILIVDGINNNRIVLDKNGITIHGDTIKIGASADQHLVLGEEFAKMVKNFCQALNTHTHTGNMGASTTPPMPQIPELMVPRSEKHLVAKT